MLQPIVLRFYGRFLYVIAGQQCHVLAINPKADTSLGSDVHQHEFMMIVRRDALDAFPAEPDFAIAVGPDPLKAEHSMWKLVGLDTAIGDGGFELREDAFEVSDLKVLTDGKGVCDPACLRVGARDRLVTGVVRLRGGIGSAWQIDKQRCRFMPLDINSSQSPIDPVKPVADMVEVTLPTPVLSFGGFNVTASETEPRFVNFSNLCCQAGESKDKEFAAYYGALTPNSSPSSGDRRVPETINLNVSEFFEVNCYKPSKIVL
jgi:hypothetical protein